MFNRDLWMRLGYTTLGGCTAIALNKYLNTYSKTHGYIPPALLVSTIVFNKDAGEIEKDIASATLGYLTVAQTLSYTNKDKNNTSETSLTKRNNPADAEKLQKIRDVTSTLGAVVDVVSKLRGS